MFFKKKPIPPLTRASTLIDEAVGIIFEYKRNKDYIPAQADLELFNQMEDKIWQHYCTVQYIIRCMNQRADGEKEGSKKFNDHDSFDYHYPNGL